MIFDTWIYRGWIQHWEAKKVLLKRNCRSDVFGSKTNIFRRTSHKQQREQLIHENYLIDIKKSICWTSGKFLFSIFITFIKSNYTCFLFANSLLFFISLVYFLSIHVQNENHFLKIFFIFIIYFLPLCRPSLLLLVRCCRKFFFCCYWFSAVQFSLRTQILKRLGAFKKSGLFLYFIWCIWQIGQF